MQAVLLPILEFPTGDAEMAKTEEQFKGLETQTNNLRERLSNIEGRLNSPPKTTHPFQTAAVSALCLAVLAYWGWIGITVVSLGNRLSAINELLAPERLQQASLDPKNPAAIKEVQQIVKRSREKKIKIPAAVIQEVGQRFVDASNSSPNAWNAALEFVNYRSFLNADSQPTFSDLTPTRTDETEYHFSITTKPISPGTMSTEQVVLRIYNAGGKASAENGARLENLNTPQTNSSGTEYLVVEGKSDDDALVLDNTYMKNVVIKDAIIDYQGGPIRLENVTFVNCKFTFHFTPRSQQLGNVLLASAKTTFSATT